MLRMRQCLASIATAKEPNPDSAPCLRLAGFPSCEHPRAGEDPCAGI